jgi:hypothetical protein
MAQGRAKLEWAMLVRSEEKGGTEKQGSKFRLENRLPVLDCDANSLGNMQILNVLGEMEGWRCRVWKLSSAHFQPLLKAFPESQDILVCLLDGEGYRPSYECVRQRLELAQISLSARWEGKQRLLALSNT